MKKIIIIIIIIIINKLNFKQFIWFIEKCIYTGIYMYKVENFFFLQCKTGKRK